jgi:hypothetical protein
MLTRHGQPPNEGDGQVSENWLARIGLAVESGADAQWRIAAAEITAKLRGPDHSQSMSEFIDEASELMLWFRNGTPPQPVEKR